MGLVTKHPHEELTNSLQPPHPFLPQDNQVFNFVGFVLWEYGRLYSYGHMLNLIMYVKTIRK